MTVEAFGKNPRHAHLHGRLQAQQEWVSRRRTAVPLMTKISEFRLKMEVLLSVALPAFLSRRPQAHLSPSSVTAGCSS